ncbi:MAG: hypothetical protein J5511_00180 [Bacilli bacterium]|nr:hypothetical protein [Bacilli bacterium]
METKIIKTNEINERQLIDTYSIFEYKCTERTVNGKRITLKFVRDDSVPYIDELKKLQYQYGSYNVGSMLPTLLLPAVSFLLFTAFLILMFALGEKFNLLLYFCTLVLPALLLLILGVVFMILRIRIIGKVQSEKPKKDQEYREKVRILKQGK